MKINRSNYEIWFIDWFDGKLSAIQIEELKLFLSENPELKEEFDELSSFKVEPTVNPYPHKNQLTKSTSDLSISQFENLCVAFLENDISDEHQKELLEIIDLDPEKKKTFELIQKTKLGLPDLRYKHKHNLIKSTIAEKIIRLSVIGLSAAAAITLIIMTYLNIPQSLSEKSNNTILSIRTDSIMQRLSPDMIPEKILSDAIPDVTEQIRENLLPLAQATILDIALPSDPSEVRYDSLSGNSEMREIELNKVPVNRTIGFKTVTLDNTLVTSNIAILIPPYDADRSKFSRFIAKTFREKIMKEELSPDSPLKGYEIAEAGISGLNKLFGWEMAMVNNNNDDGELISVSFSSKILKFNTPVKKSEPLQ